MIESTGTWAGKSHPLIDIVENNAAAANDLANELSHLELVWRNMSGFTIPLVVEHSEGARSEAAGSGREDRKALNVVMHASADEFIRSLNRGNVPDVLLIDEDIFVKDEDIVRFQEALSEIIDIKSSTSQRPLRWRMPCRDPSGPPSSRSRSPEAVS